MMRALTGIKPTNLLHLGNYFGALLPAVEMQKEYELSMMIADLHAITIPQKPEELSQNITFITATYLATGIDPHKTLLFQQSQVPAHAELAWLLQCVARMGEAERMTQYKDKTAKGEIVSVGLLTYPILMAADILLYDSDVVPVGADQKQHVELARNLAERFNRDFGNTFTVPKPVIRKEGAKILGLDDPSKKMSKSAPSEKNYISLLDDADIIRKKIKSAVTDSIMGITYDEQRPGLHNLLTLFALATGQDAERITLAYADKGMKNLKEDVSEAIIAMLLPLQEKIRILMDDRAYLASVVAEGNARAHEITASKVQQAKKAMGLAL
ncbi:tryptophan--tRNA ligase [bacterium]|nr:tryptophan--tRNA ligase [bacterium]